MVFTLGFKEQKDLIKFMRLLSKYAESDKEDGQFLRDALDGKLGAVEDEKRMVALFVSGRKIKEGPLSEIKLRFSQEIGSHSAGVEIREQTNGGEWKVIHSRKFQR